MNNLTEEGQPDLTPDVKRIFSNHQEALVIVVDEDDTVDDESNISCFMKMGEDDSRLASYLSKLLENLLNIRNGKTSSHIQT